MMGRWMLELYHERQRLVADEEVEQLQEVCGWD